MISWWYRSVLMLGLALPGVRLLAGEVELELRPEVLLQQPQIKLADLALIRAADAALQHQMEELVVGRAPLIGHVDLRTRAELDLLLRSQVVRAPQAIAWRGAVSTKIRRASQALPSARLLGIAQQYLRSQYHLGADEADIRLDGVLAEVAAPPGELQLVPRMAPAGRLRARMPVWIDVIAQDAVYRSVVVPLLVSVRRPVYVARHALAAGARVTASDFDVDQQDIAALADEALTPAMLAGGAARLRQDLDAGQVATLRQVAPADMVLRGDQVRLQTAAAGIEIETGAYAQADGKLGQHIPVRVEGR
jgi:flagella basal body P-ring formation protein FlgA